MQAVASLKADQLGSARALARLFSAVELDFSDSISDAGAKSALRACERAGLEVKAVHLPNPNRLAAMVGSRRIPRALMGLSGTVFVCHPWLRADVREKEDLERLAGSLENSNRLVIENVTNHHRIFSSATEVADYFGKPRPFHFCLDTSHMVLRHCRAGTQVVLGFMQAAARNLAHIHLSDVHFDDGRKHLPLGDGQMEWPPFFDLLKRNKYTGLLTLELNDADLDAYRRSLQLLSGFGVSTDGLTIGPLLSLVNPQEAATLLAEVAGEGDSSGLLALLAGKAPLFRYSDERISAVIFDKASAEFLPFLTQADFPKEVPGGKGLIAIFTDAYHMVALYLSRAERVAVRTTLGDLSSDTPSKTIGDFLADIKYARSIAFGSSEMVRLLDGQLVT
jgi:sugar phosphate isomerase/epimerase